MAGGARLKRTEEAAAVDAGTGRWEAAIDRYLKRRKVEGGLSANSFEAYSSDLLDFREFCGRLDIELEAIDGACLTAYLKTWLRANFASAVNGGGSPQCGVLCAISSKLGRCCRIQFWQ